MKNLFLLLMTAFVAVSCSRTPESDKATTSEAKQVSNADGDAWKVDPASSTLKWIGTKVSGYHSGTIAIREGNVYVKDNAITGGRIVMDMKTLEVNGPSGSDDAMNKKLQGHLTSGDFFEVEKYPEAVFEITAVTPTTDSVTENEDPRQADISKYKVSNPTHRVSGNLTIKDVTRNIEFPAKINMADGTLETTAKFNIDRTMWNITYPGKPDDLIRKEIHIGLYIKAVK